MFKIYLAGYISGNAIEECLKWRNHLTDIYRKNKDIKFINPLAGHDTKSISDQGLTSDIPNKGIIYKDYISVSNSDLIIVNLDTFGEDRPLIGTIAELAWAWEKKIPVIAFGGRSYYYKHPFIDEFITVYEDNLENLIYNKYIEYFSTK